MVTQCDGRLKTGTSLGEGFNATSDKGVEEEEWEEMKEEAGWKTGREEQEVEEEEELRDEAGWKCRRKEEEEEEQEGCDS